MKEYYSLRNLYGNQQKSPNTSCINLLLDLLPESEQRKSLAVIDELNMLLLIP